MQTTKKRRLLFLFDIDGVIAETPHEEAWKKAAVDWGIIDSAFDFTLFYAENVAGEPGTTGAANILALLKPAGGEPYFERQKIDDPEARSEKALEFRRRKQGFLDKEIGAGNFRVFVDAGKVVLRARLEGVPVSAVSASENAEKILSRIDLARFCEREGVQNPLGGRKATFVDVFDTTALGAISYWHGVHIEKIHHYAMAYGRALEAAARKYGIDETPYAIVFEDAPKGVSAVRELGFLPIGISRRSTSGVELAPKEALREAGAALAYDEDEFGKLAYEDLMRDILAALPLDSE